jgi:hypothetical protein
MGCRPRDGRELVTLELLIFAIKYAIGVAMALLPTHRAEIAVLDIAVAGTMAGYFLGWLGRLTISALRMASRPGAVTRVGEIL